ncbi:hypothetical protein F152LOC_00267 [Pectobacterium brasiliense]|nr:hypothetical protein F152LOC_00267 [Pectobacterium brasiliense]
MSVNSALKPFLLGEQHITPMNFFPAPGHLHNLSRGQFSPSIEYWMRITSLLDVTLIQKSPGFPGKTPVDQSE